MTQKTTKLGKTRIPILTDWEREQGARGFVIVTSANPLPTGKTAYKLIVNADAVITTYKERKPDGGGSDDMLAKRGLTGVTIISGNTLPVPKNNPCSELALASGSIIAWLEDN